MRLGRGNPLASDGGRSLCAPGLLSAKLGLDVACEAQEFDPWTDGVTVMVLPCTVYVYYMYVNSYIYIYICMYLCMYLFPNK